MRTEEGGIMGLPFPARSDRDAAALADEACAVFSTELLWLEDTGLEA